VHELCGYCALEPAEDKEHVVPQCLLVDANKPVLIPACRACDLSKSREDEYLRDVFAIRIETSELPEMKEKRDAMIRSTEREGRFPPARQILSTMRK
jgi:hypothetical protein